MISGRTQGQRADATPPSLQAIQNPDPEPLAHLIGLSTVIVSLTFVGAGMVWPQAADALLRLLLATIAVGFAAARGFEAVQHMRTREDQYSPFDRPAPVWTPPAAPRALRELTTELAAADNARVAQRSGIPRSARLTIRSEASRRLAERHGLVLSNPSDQPRIRSLVSEPTWLLIRRNDPKAWADRGQTARGHPVPLSQLGLILDDLERL